MRRSVLCLAWILCSVAGIVSRTDAQTPPPIANRPAATLLLPYFEVDLDNEAGRNTLFSVNNGSGAATIARVVIWSDLGVPVFLFNVYLTGYDAQQFDLREVLLGTVPQTATRNLDPGDRISPQGPLSQDINFPGCNGILPPPPVPEIYQPYLREALTGQGSSFHSGMCVSRNHGTPSIARGYVTVDSALACGLTLPDQPGYFAQLGSSFNSLWGDFSLVDPEQDTAYADSLVHIATFSGDPAIAADRYTFYGRLVGWNGTDQREPLATNFAARFVAAKDFKTPAKARRKAFLPPSTELLVWRDPKVAAVEPFACGGAPPWYPLGQEQIRAFDEQEESELPSFAPSAPPFPGATQRVAVGSSALPLTFASGWLFLNLNTNVTQAGSNPLSDPLSTQGWVSVLQRVQQGPNGGRYDVGTRAIRLDSARTPAHVVIQ